MYPIVGMILDTKRMKEMKIFHAFAACVMLF